MKNNFSRLLLIFISLWSLQLHAQQVDFKPDDYWQKNYSSVIANNTSQPANAYGDMLEETEQDDWATMTSNPNWENSFTYKSVTNIIKVSIDHDKATIVPDNYKYRIDLKIHGKTSPGAAFQDKFVSLVIEYNKDAGEVYNDLSLFKLEGAGFHYFTTQLLDIVDLNQTTPATVPRADLAENFYIETKVIVQKYDKGSFYIRTFSRQDAQTPAYVDVWWQSLAGNPTTPNCNQALVPACGNTIKPVMYEMEWTYIDNYKYNLANGNPAGSGPLTNNPTLVNYDFRNNSTRITTNNSCYQIPRVYEKGFIVFRVRSIRPDLANYSNWVYSDWTLPDNGTIDLNGSDCSWQYAQKLDAYENDKFNWQYSVSFAEEGKHKGVINYFDGAGYNRQTQTKINSDNDYTIVAEKIYDYEGRPAIQTLPVPVWSQDLKYKPGLSISKATNLPYKAADFDIGCLQDSIAPFKETSLASLYYSPANTHQEGMQQFVPDAQGYPFTETVYAPDNTNKVLWQGGAGLSMQRWKGHGTRYTYVRAGQNEMDKLLGTESGYFEYYPKQIVVDPNSQASFSIFNPAGKVVATALAGSAPSDTAYPIQPLSGLSAPLTYTSELLAGLSQQVGDGRRMAEHNFFAEAAGANTLQYKATLPPYDPLCANEYLKVNARYSVRVVDECGAVQAEQAGIIGDGNVVSASNTAYNFTGASFSTPSLPPDKYTIIKELYFPDTSMQRLAKDFVNDHIGYTDCYLTADSFIRQTVEAATFPCVTSDTPTTCDMRKRKMMDELYPGAKYGLYVQNASGQFGGEVSGNSIFSSVNTACEEVSGTTGWSVGPNVAVFNGIPAQIVEISEELFLAQYVLQDLSAITFSDSTVNAGARPRISFRLQVPRSELKDLDSLMAAPRNNPDIAFADGLYQLTGVVNTTNCNSCGSLGDVIFSGSGIPPGIVFNTTCNYRVTYVMDPEYVDYDVPPEDGGSAGSGGVGSLEGNGTMPNPFQELCAEIVDIITVASVSDIPLIRYVNDEGCYGEFNLLDYELLGCNGTVIPPVDPPPPGDDTFYRYQSPCIDTSLVIQVAGTPNANGWTPVTELHINQLTPDQLIRYFSDDIAEALLPLHPEYCKLLMCEAGDFETRLENTDSFQEAAAMGLSTLSGILNQDPLCQLADPDAPFTADELSYYNMDASLTGGGISNFLRRLDTMALERAWCGCNSPEPYLYCKNAAYATAINTMSMPDNGIKDLFFQHLKELYLGNRNMRKQQAFDLAGNDCEPCAACRMDPVGDPVFPSLLSADGTSLSDSISNDEEYGSWMDPVIADGINGTTGNTVPAGLAQELAQISAGQNISQVEEIVRSLASCGMSQATINNVKNALLPIDPSHSGAGITPADVRKALLDNNVALSDLCTPFLAEYGIYDRKKYASKGDYVNKKSGFYSGITSFLNRQKVKDALLAASAGGSGNYSLNLLPGNLFEQELATVLGVTSPLTQAVTIKAYLVGVSETDGSYYKIVSSYSGNTDTLFLVNRQLAEPLPAYSPADASYDVDIAPQNVMPGTVTADFADIHSVLDDALVTAAERGRLAPYLVFGNYINEATASGQTYYKYANYVIWSHNILMLRPKEADAPENCVTCIAIRDEVNHYFADATAYSLPVHTNHPLFETSLTNYLNYQFGRRHHFEEYERLMKGCALTDHILIPRSDAYIQATFSNDAAAATYLGSTLAAAWPGINFSSFRYNKSNGNTVVWWDLQQVPPASLKAVKQYIMSGAPAAVYLPAATGTVKVFLKQGCPAPAFANTTMTSQSVTVPNFNNTSTSCTLYHITPNDTSAAGVADLLAAVNDFYHDPQNCRAQYITGTAQLYRSGDYDEPVKQDYLNYSDYLYNLYSNANASLDEVNSQLSPVILKQVIPSLSAASLKLSYSDAWCRNVKEDLYYYDVPAANEPGWTRLKDIITRVKATLGSSKLFPATNAVTDISLSGSSLGTSLKAYRMADGGVWYRLFGPEARLYNVYLYPSERMITVPSGYAAVAGTTNDPNPLPLPGADSLFRFSVRMVYNSHYVTCDGYTDFPLGGGHKLDNVVLYDNQNDYQCMDTMPCERAVLYTAVQQGRLQHRRYTDSVAGSHFLAMKQFFPAHATDELYLTTRQQQYQYTLYYYDLAGNLTRTVPPAGVHPIGSTTQEITNIDAARNSASAATQVTLKPAHTKVSAYKYNSLNQLTWQQTPDGGITEFFYDAAGRLAFSQNARQQPVHKYSYTLYDEQGRISETGAIAFEAPTPPQVHPYPVLYSHNTQMNTPGGIADIVHSKAREDVVATLYDNQLLNLGAVTGLSPQQNLRKRVSAILYAPYITESNTISSYYSYATHFSYDAMGNVSTLVHDNPYLDYMGQRFKRIDYDYDLLSGKVNMLSYNRGLADQVYYRYDYDADNRITAAYSSKEGLEWDRDAAYEYYKHGPLAAVHIGDLQVQSVQYAYTIQGWLKAVNGDVLNAEEDMGQDGIAANPDLNIYPKDVMSHALDYYAGDYQPIGTTPVMHTLPGNGISRSLYNGNIARQTTAMAGLQSPASLQRDYEYDQLNRIKQATYATMDNISHAVTSLGQAFKNTYAYDADGNITSLARRDGSSNVIDNFTYGYYSPGAHNRLSHVADAAGATTPGADLQPGQAAGNYEYDATGNLVKDVQEGIQEIEWNLYGKVRHLARGTATEDTMDLYFSYDGAGNRVRKDYIHPSETEGIQQRESDIYVRDAAGNILAVYHTSSQLDGAAIIEWINDDIVNQDGDWVTPQGTGLGPFVVGQLGSNGIFVNHLIGEAIDADRTWIEDITKLPVGFYLGHSEEILGMAVGGPFFDADLAYYDTLIAYDSNAILPAALQGNANGNAVYLLQAIWNPQHTGEYYSKAFEQLVNIVPDIADSILSGTGLVHPDSLTYLNGGEKVEMLLTGIKRDLLPQYVSLYLQAAATTPTAGYYRAITQDFAFREILVEQGKDNPVVINYLRNIMMSDSTAHSMLPAFFSTILDDTWLEEKTTLADRTNVVYQGDRLAYIVDFLGKVGLASLNRSIVATGVSGTLYTDWVVNAVQNGGTLNPGYNPPQVNTPDPDNLLGENMYLAEHHLYGSSRLGILHYGPGDYKAVYADNELDEAASSLNKRQPWYSGKYRDWIKADKAEEYTAGVYNISLDTFRQRRWLGRKEYELTDHLGNVLVTVLDRKTGYGSSNGNYAGFNADIASVTDYYPFGMPISNRTLTIGNGFRFGFNGKENDKEVSGQQDYGLRIYNTWIARFSSVDPLFGKYPFKSSYDFAENNPVWAIDLDGGEMKIMDGVRAVANTISSNLEEANTAAKTSDSKAAQVAIGAAAFLNNGLYSLAAMGGSINPQPNSSTIPGCGGVAPYTREQQEENRTKRPAKPFERDVEVLVSDNADISAKTVAMLNIGTTLLPFFMPQAEATIAMRDMSFIPEVKNVVAKEVGVSFGGKNIPVYRGGNSFTLKPGEFKVNPETGMVKTTHGVSLDVNPNTVSKFGGAYKIESMPKGLNIIQRGGRLEHFEIVPSYEMSVEQFQNLLNQIKTTPAK